MRLLERRAPGRHRHGRARRARRSRPARRRPSGISLTEPAGHRPARPCCRPARRRPGRIPARSSDGRRPRARAAPACRRCRSRHRAPARRAATAPARARQFLHDERPQAAIPPHAVLDRMHALVFARSTPSAPPSVFLPPLMISSPRLANRHDQTARSVSPRLERLLLVPLFALPVLWLAGYFFPPINHDVAAILDVSARWVGGEKLYVEVIDENLPLTFIVHALPVLTAKLLPGSVPVLVHRLGGGRHRRLVLRLQPPGAAGAVGRPCADRGAAAAGAAVPVHRAAQRAFRPARAHHVRGLRALPDRLDGARRGRHARPRLVRSPSAWSAGVFLAMKPYYLAIPAAVELFLLIRRGWRTTFTDPDPVVDRSPWPLAHLVSDVHGVPRVRPVRHAARASNPTRRSAMRAGARC